MGRKLERYGHENVVSLSLSFRSIPAQHEYIIHVREHRSRPYHAVFVVIHVASPVKVFAIPLQQSQTSEAYYD